MFKRQHYALEHSGKDSASSASSSSLDTSSDGDSGASGQIDDAAWPESSHESDESSPKEEVAVESSASVAARRAEAIHIAERKLAEAAEDAGEFEDECSEDVKGADAPKNSGDEAEDSDAQESYEVKGHHQIRKTDDIYGTFLQEAHTDGDASVEPTGEVLAQRKVSNQWAEAVEEDEPERKLEMFVGNTVICIGDENNVFKCRVCPKVVCLNKETMLVHLDSKRHRRSTKQLAEGRLKIQLDSDGDEDEDGETHAERYARTVAAAQESKEEAKKRKKDAGRQRQRFRDRIKKKAGDKAETGVLSTAGKNRKERRARLHGESDERKKRPRHT